MKKDYVTPKLEDLGSVRELTLAQSSGGVLDADFPAGTPFGDITLS